jgi:myo-inositol 2-dehydrogenase/D-chiro-inositol 1-dehydrogenase
MSLRVGIVGAGHTGVQQAKRLKRYPDVEIIGIADPNRPARDAFAKEFGTRLAVSDHRRLAMEADIDVIYVCSPPNTHSTVTIDSLKSGKHVICHQPMATSLEQADEMLAVAEAQGNRLFVAMPQRYDPAFQEVARILESGEIGYPFLVSMVCIYNEFERLNDWHDWVGTWEIGGGGILMLFGSGAIDLLQALFGEIGAVSAVCTRFAIEPLTKAEDSCLLTLEFVEDLSAQIAISGAVRYSPWPENYQKEASRLEIYGVDGSIQASSSEPRIVVSSRRTKRRVVASSDLRSALPTDMDRDFLDSILHGREPLATATDARNALRVILASYKASQMKRRVEVMEQL